VHNLFEMTRLGRNRAHIAFFVFLATTIQGAHARPTGAEACEDPEHGSNMATGDGGYTLAVTTGLITAGSEVTLTLSGTSTFQGFSVFTDQGTFSITDPNTKMHGNCESPGYTNVLNDEKDSVTVTFVLGLAGTTTLKYTVVKQFDTWFKGALTLTVAEATATSPPTTSALPTTTPTTITFAPTITVPTLPSPTPSPTARSSTPVATYLNRVGEVGGPSFRSFRSLLPLLPPPSAPNDTAPTTTTPAFTTLSQTTTTSSALTTMAPTSNTTSAPTTTAQTTATSAPTTAPTLPTPSPTPPSLNPVVTYPYLNAFVIFPTFNSTAWKEDTFLPAFTMAFEEQVAAGAAVATSAVRIMQIDVETSTNAIRVLVNVAFLSNASAASFKETIDNNPSAVFTAASFATYGTMTSASTLVLSPLPAAPGREAVAASGPRGVVEVAREESAAGVASTHVCNIRLALQAAVLVGWTSIVAKLR